MRYTRLEKKAAEGVDSIMDSKSPYKDAFLRNMQNGTRDCLLDAETQGKILKAGGDFQLKSNFDSKK